MEFYQSIQALLNNSTNSDKNSTDLDIRQMDAMLTEFRATLFTYQDGKTVALICLYIPIFIIAFFGNLLVLLVVIPNRHMRSMTNCFIVNLAIADLLGKFIMIRQTSKMNLYRISGYSHIRKMFLIRHDSL